MAYKKSENPRCPECRSTKVWKKGTMPKRGGPIIRYVCTMCGKNFIAKSKRSTPKK